MKRRQKTGFVSPRNSKIIETKEKERRKRKNEEKRKKAMVALLVFIMATLKILLGRKQLLDAKSPFGGNVNKNPARYGKLIIHHLFRYMYTTKINVATLL